MINARDNFWLVTQKNKAAADNWMKDLATRTSLDAKGRSIYTVLARRIPIFNKKEEVLISLCEHNVPIMRGVWLIKMTAAYALAMSETSKTKKRQVRYLSFQLIGNTLIITCLLSPRIRIRVYMKMMLYFRHWTQDLNGLIVSLSF